jgi:hypothetical protein
VYVALKASHPDLLFWAPGPTFEGLETSPEGGQRFVFSYRALDGCHACAILAGVRVAFDFAPDGTFGGWRLLNVAPHESGR